MANQVVTVLEADGTTETDVEVLGFGRQVAAASKSIVLGTEDKAVFDAIAASLAILDNVVAGNEVQVDVLTLPELPTGNNNIGDVDVVSSALPTGASTAANQSTIIGHLDGVETSLTAIAGHVDGLEGLLTTIDGDTGGILTSVELIDDAIKADDAAFTPATTKVMMAGFQADEASTDSVDEGDAGAARMTLDRKQITTAQPHTSGGLSKYKSLDLDESEEEVKDTAGQLYGFYVVNRRTSPLFLKFYDADADDVTVGTTVPDLTFEIPANATDHIGASVNFGGLGIEFVNAITMAATTGFADNDSGAPGANEMIINVFYK